MILSKYKVTKNEVYLAIDCKPSNPLFGDELDSREFVDYEDYQTLEQQRDMLFAAIKAAWKADKKCLHTDWTKLIDQISGKL